MNNVLDVICVDKAKIEGKGEDAAAFYFSRPDIHYIGVYDGCGGAGAKKYRDMTGAYIASRYAAYIVGNLYENGIQFSDLKENIYKNLKSGFDNLNKKLLSESSGLKIGGTMVKSLPTTASMIFIEDTGSSDIIKCNYIWAGDSRGYFLDSSGMHQITKDDLNSDEDAFSNLYNDGVLSNVICADNNFFLNSRIINIKLPAIVVSATDGSFGYYSTPMEFEYAVLSTLFESESTEEWEEKLTVYTAEASGDDSSLLLALYGFESFSSLKKYFKARYEHLYYDYMQFITECSNEDLLYNLWLRYKKDYYREM